MRVEAGGCAPGTPITPGATVVPNGVSLSLSARAGTPAPTGFKLLVGSVTGHYNLGTFPLPAIRTFTTAAPPGRYFARLVASNGCGDSAPTAETSFTVPGALPRSLVGTWDGVSTGNPHFQSFTLNINAELPFAGYTQARFTSNTGCNHTMIAAGYLNSSGAPFVSLEQFGCRGADFSLQIQSYDGNVAEGVCPHGGAACRFRMTRR